MTAALALPRADLIHGDCRDELRQLPDRSVDCSISDTPYEYKSGFMGQSWDREGTAFDPALWTEVKRVCKPGAWVAAFGGRQSWHRLACAALNEGRSSLLVEREDIYVETARLRLQHAAEAIS